MFIFSLAGSPSRALDKSWWIEKEEPGWSQFFSKWYVFFDRREHAFKMRVYEEYTMIKVIEEGVNAIDNYDSSRDNREAAYLSNIKSS